MPLLGRILKIYQETYQELKVYCSMAYIKLYAVLILKKVKKGRMADA